MSLTELILISLYLTGSVIASLYVFISHLIALQTYFRRLLTAKKVIVSDIKTCFGWQFYEYGYDSDHWGEVTLMSTLQALIYTALAFVAWPGIGFIIINRIILNARERIERDS